MKLSRYREKLFYPDQEGFKRYIPRPVFWVVYFMTGRLNSRGVRYEFKWAGVIKLFLKNVLRKNGFCVGWFLCGNKNTPSSRIQGINIHNYLLGKKIDSILCYGTSFYSEELRLNRLSQWLLLNSGSDVFIFQKVYRGIAGEFLKKCRKKGIKTVLIIPDYPPDHEISSLNAYDSIIVISKYFKQVLCSKGVDEARVSVIEDAIETPVSLRKGYGKVKEGPIIKVVWVGYELTPAQHTALEIVRDALRDKTLDHYRLVVICKGPGADIRWNIRTVWTEILKCDIAVIPSDMSATNYLIKSNNRVTMFKALGLPVICSRVPAYRDIIRDGESGFFAETREDWIRCLNILRDKETRRRIGLADREKTFSLYGIETIGEKYLRLFQALSS